jgi:hypothetical protein
MGCCPCVCVCVCVCHFLLQMSLKCRETLRVACWSSEECKFTAIFSCLSLINLRFHFECCRSLKSWFHGKMVSPAGRIPLWGHGSELLDLRFLLLWLKRKTFWVVAPCSSEGTQHFRGAYHVHLHGWRVNWTENHQNISFLPASAGFLIGLLFDPECADDIFFCNTVLSPNYTVCYNPEDCSLQGSCRLSHILCILQCLNDREAGEKQLQMEVLKQ